MRVYSVSFDVFCGVLNQKLLCIQKKVVCFLRLPWVYQTYQLNDMNLSLGNLVLVGLEQTFTNTSLSRTLWPLCQYANRYYLKLRESQNNGV